MKAREEVKPREEVRPREVPKPPAAVKPIPPTPVVVVEHPLQFVDENDQETTPVDNTPIVDIPIPKPTEVQKPQAIRIDQTPLPSTTRQPETAKADGATKNDSAASYKPSFMDQPGRSQLQNGKKRSSRDLWFGDDSAGHSAFSLFEEGRKLGEISCSFLIDLTENSGARELIVKEIVTTERTFLKTLEGIVKVNLSEISCYASLTPTVLPGATPREEHPR